MYSQSDSTQSQTASHPTFALLARRILTGGLAVVAGLIGTQLAAPVEASAAATARSGLHQDGTGAVKLSGPWTSQTSDKAIGGSYANLNGKGEAQITFKSTGVAWIGRRNAYAGIAAVYLDGKKTKTVDLYSATTKYAQVVYKVTGLKNTTHTLKVVRTGTKNAKSSGGNLIVDAFNVLDTVAPAAPTGLSATAEATGARITWRSSPGTDIAGYRVYRNTGSTRTLIGTTTAAKSSFLDIGLANATTYRYTVTAHDTSANTSTASTSVAVETGKAPATETRRYANCPTATTTVTNRAELLTALAAAEAGTVIVLEPGSYPGPFPIKAAHGTSEKPIWVCGPRTAVIDSGDYTRSGGLRIDTSSHVIIAGLTVRQSQKGIAVINSHHIVVADTRVDHIGDEAIHLRNSTTDSVVIANSIEYTGLMTSIYGEGIYVGSSEGTGAPTTTAKPTPATTTPSPATTSATPPPTRSRPRKAPSTAPSPTTPSTAPAWTPSTPTP